MLSLESQFVNLLKSTTRQWGILVLTMLFWFTWNPTLDAWGISQSHTFINSGQNLGLSYSKGIALGDFDGDGDLDVVFANNLTTEG